MEEEVKEAQVVEEKKVEVKPFTRKRGKLPNNAELRAELKMMKAKLKEMTEISESAAIVRQTVDVGNGKETAEITFFTELDYNAKGQLKSVYPFYHNTKVMDDAREDLRRMEKSVASNSVPSEYLPQTMEMIKSTKTLLDTYEAHLPALRKNIDGVIKTRDILSSIIAPSLFTRKEMSLGLVDPHEEARRMAEPCIDVPQELRSIAAKNGVMMDKKHKASRNDISRLYQMCQRELGEPADVEYLRRD
jgi:hypothetical protein